MKECCRFKALLLEEDAQGEWNTIYLILVFMIAALILISVVKPMFQQSQQIVAKTREEVLGD